MAELPYVKHCRNELIKHSFGMVIGIDHVKNIYSDFWAEGSKHLSQLGEHKEEEKRKEQCTWTSYP